MSAASAGAVVVAAGLSSRMQTFKPLLALGGSTIIRTAITGLRAAGVAPIAVVTGHRAVDLQAHLRTLSVDCLFNGEYATTDMFHSACIGLRHLQDRCDRLFFLPGDVPLFKAESLLRLLAAMEGSGSPLVVPVHQGRRGHPVLIANRAIPTLLSYRGGMGLRGAMAAIADATLLLPLDDQGVLLDADQPEDYRQLLQYAEERRGAPAPPGSPDSDTNQEEST